MVSVTSTLTSMAATDVGQPIPDTAHAVSVSLPSWRANVGYEEGEEWVISKMKTGYPRFFVHLSIKSFADAIISKHGRPGEEAMLFPSRRAADRCKEFLLRQREHQLNREIATSDPRIFDLVIGDDTKKLAEAATVICAILFPSSDSKNAKRFWQHSGEGISSRRAEFFRKAFDDGHLCSRTGTKTPEQATSPVKGLKRYSRQNSSLGKGNSPISISRTPDANEAFQFLEERYGRNLDMSLSNTASLAIKKRIAGHQDTEEHAEDAMTLNSDASKIGHVTIEDVYLFSCGMNAIFNIHQILMRARGQMRSIMFGFPYIDTLKILENWGPGCQFYGHSSAQELDDLEARLEAGEKFLALFCEFPGNPLLKTPDLERIRILADKYDFAVVVDETIGNFLNVNVLPAVDIVVSSLTKIFSGDSNVMGGSAVLNPQSRYYDQLKTVMREDYEDNYWAEDVIYMERNSRDFVSRNERINQNSELICRLLKDSGIIKELYYPRLSESRSLYDKFKNPTGGYGGLFSITFHSPEEATTFFDALDTAKGPSLGTNFTLSCPFVILAHYNELEWAAQYGAEANLVRISTGLEQPQELAQVFRRALEAVEKVKKSKA